MTVRAVPLTLGGREWSLRCTLGAMAAVEDMDTDFRTVLGKLTGPTPSMQATQRIIWALLRDNPEPPTLEQVGQWVDTENFAAVLEAVGACLQAAFPKENGTANPPGGRGTGKPLRLSPTARSVSSPTPSGV